MPEEQRDRLAQFATKILNDPELRMPVKKLVKARDATFTDPELELEDKLGKQAASFEEKLAKQKEEFDGREMARTQAETEKLIKAEGFTPEDIYKIIKEDRIGSIPAAIELARARAQSKAAQDHSVNYTDQTMRFSDNFKEMQKNPMAWARREAHKVIDEIKAARGR
jgi:hypothetical protein